MTHIALNMCYGPCGWHEMAIFLNTWSTLQFFYNIESAYNSFFFSPKQKKDRVVLPLNLDEYVSWGLFNGASQGILGPMKQDLFT